jgi:hypothetical protein
MADGDDVKAGRITGFETTTTLTGYAPGGLFCSVAMSFLRSIHSLATTTPVDRD